MLIDELLQDFRRQSSSSWAKKALASLRISLALHSSLFSRSSAFMCSRSDVVTPSRAPVSIWSRLTYSFRVYGTQPILGAIDSIAAHSEGYSLRCSRTMRTAPSRTSGENWFDFLLMAQSSQDNEPPQNPGWFESGLGRLLHAQDDRQSAGQIATSATTAKVDVHSNSPYADQMQGICRVQMSRVNYPPIPKPCGTIRMARPTESHL